jgi:hypothetical protein
MHGYPDIRAMIDETMRLWRAEGKRTRRSWWEMLAGDLQGNPRHMYGVEFPVLRAARRRQQLPDVPQAIFRSENESIPPVRHGPRWRGKRKGTR